VSTQRAAIEISEQFCNDRFFEKAKRNRSDFQHATYFKIASHFWMTKPFIILTGLSGSNQQNWLEAKVALPMLMTNTSHCSGWCRLDKLRSVTGGLPCVKIWQYIKPKMVACWIYFFQRAISDGHRAFHSS
jgi:hypothetical protein